VRDINGALEPTRKNLLGAVGLTTMVTRPGDTAAAMGDGDLAILSNSFYLRLMESAALAGLSEFLSLAETTILTQFECNIEGSVGIGIDLNATATVVALDGASYEEEKKDQIREALLIECEIHDGVRRVAHGMMRREIVERVSYAAKTAAFSLLAQGPE
jgi:predicted thioesterase